MSDTPILTIKHLCLQIDTSEGTIEPVSKVDFSILKGQIFALVGESGSGKTLTALSINRLIPENAYICEGSEIILNNIALQTLSENQMQKYGASMFL